MAPAFPRHPRNPDFARGSYQFQWVFLSRDPEVVSKALPPELVFRDIAVAQLYVDAILERESAHGVLMAIIGQLEDLLGCNIFERGVLPDTVLCRQPFPYEKKVRLPDTGQAVIVASSFCFISPRAVVPPPRGCHCDGQNTLQTPTSAQWHLTKLNTSIGEICPQDPLNSD